MSELLSLSIIQTLGLTLLHFLWQGSIVGIILFIALCVLRKPQTRYLASCLALLILAGLPVVTFMNLLEAPINVQIPAQQNDVAISPTTPDTVATPEPTPAQLEQPTQTIMEKSRLTLYLPWIVLTWFVGALIFSFKLLFSFVALHRFRTKGVKLAEKTLQLKLLEFAKQLSVKQYITLLESRLVPVPVVLGWLRPVILLPTSAVTGLSPRQLEMLLAHELAHVMRRDYLVNVLQSGLESLLFYHPVVWWVSSQIRKEREYCCDDIAVSLTGNPQHYAQTLLSLAEIRFSLAPSASGGQLFTRISRLLQPMETEMKPSYWFAGLSVLGVLTALVLTVVNVSDAQENKAELWVTVVGDVTFSENYSEIESMAPDAYIVIEERSDFGDKKFYAKFLGLNSGTLTDELGEAKMTTSSGIVIPLEQIEINDSSMVGHHYKVGNETKVFDEIELAWYKQAFKDAISQFYPRESKNPTMLGAERYEDKASGRTIYFIAEPTGFENTFMNMSTAQWETTPVQSELLDKYREDIRYQTQRYTAGLLKDRSFAGYLDGFTASPDFPTELFSDALEATNEIKDAALKQQLFTLIETRSKTPKEHQLIFVTAEHSFDQVSGTIESKFSSDGKNRISGRVFINGEPASFANVGISIPLDAAVDPGLAIANTGSNKEGKFSFTGFDIPPGEYIISFEHEDISFYNFLPFSVRGQELEINLSAKKNFKTLEPKNDAVVTTTPTLSWEGLPDAVRYVVAIHDNKINEQFVYQVTEAATLILDLPLEPKKDYVWTVTAYNKNGEPINVSTLSKFYTE